VTPGARTFFVQYRAGSGRSAPKRRVSLGQYGAITIDEARRAARKVLAEVAQGNDPALTRNAAKTAPKLLELGVEFLEHGLLVADMYTLLQLAIRGAAAIPSPHEATGDVPSRHCSRE